MERLCLDIYVLNDFFCVAIFSEGKYVEHINNNIYDICFSHICYITIGQIYFTFFISFLKRVFCLFDNTVMLIYSNCKHIKFKHHIYAFSCI